MDTLPSYVQSAIHSSDWERKILNIGRKYGLHVDQLEILQTELSLAVLGLSDRQEFVHEVMKEARVNKETMDLMVGEINRDIFIPIREALRQAQEDFEKQQAREVAEESDDENEFQNPSRSGLEQDEEDILKSHGLSFDDEKESDTGFVQDISEKPVLVQGGAAAQPQLNQPLMFNNKKTQEKETSSISSLSSVLGTIDIQPMEKSNSQQDGVFIESQKSEKTLIHGEDIDISKLAGAKTSEHQNIINNSSSSGYVKKDPYREPLN